MDLDLHRTKPYDAEGAAWIDLIGFCIPARKDLRHNFAVSFAGIGHQVRHLT